MSAAATEVSTPRYVGRIPVRNLWWLMLYASDLYRVEGGVAPAGAEQADSVADLVGRVLVDAVESRLQRQPTTQFTAHAAVLRRVRGRIDPLRTARRALLWRGVVACRFTALDVDNQRNRLVRRALEAAVRLATVPALRQRARVQASALRAAGVGAAHDRGPAPVVAGGASVDPRDRRMLAAARLLLELALPVEGAGTRPIPAPDAEVHRLRHLFERAVGGFFAVTLPRPEWRVRTGVRLDWQLDRAALAPWLKCSLPEMQTDIVLEQPAACRRVIIDTKFNAIVVPGFRRASTLRSGYLYQIYAYLQSQVRARDPITECAEGLLLHPSVGEDVDESLVVQRHRIRFATVNLAADGAAIGAQLLRLIMRST